MENMKCCDEEMNEISLRMHISTATIHKWLYKRKIAIRNRIFHRNASTPPGKVCSDENKRAYVAGLIDGEGTIHRTKTRKGNLSYDIEIFNNNKQCLQFVQDNFGGTIYERHRKTSPNTQYIWRMSCLTDIIIFLEQIIPFVIIKKQGVTEALSYAKKRLEDAQQFTLLSLISKTSPHLDDSTNKLLTLLTTKVEPHQTPTLIS